MSIISAKRIKTEPSVQEDQDDLLMSYLNSECMATSIPCWTNNSSIIDQKCNLRHDAVSLSDDFKESDHTWPYFSSPSSASSPSASDLLTDVSLLWAAQNHQGTHFYHDLTCSPSSYFHVATPTSPSSFSSCSSLEVEKPRKKRGRKKRNNLRSISLTPTPQPCSPVVIAPAPLKQLTLILPASEQAPKEIKNEKQVCVKREDEKSNLIQDSLPTPPVNSQKAAIIAKRQERLIKNRAAALLSRKRKREHLIALEDQRKELLDANQSLNEQIRQLQIENIKLHKRLNNDVMDTGTSDSFICMIITMILLFYCTYFASSSSSEKRSDLIEPLDNTSKSKD